MNLQIGTKNFQDQVIKKNKYAQFHGHNNHVNQTDQLPSRLSIEQIPVKAFMSRINFNGTAKILQSQLKPQDIKRAVIVNDQDFSTIGDTSMRTISGVHPGVPLRTDTIIVEDTRIKPVVPTATGGLIFPVDSLEFDQVNALVHASETTDMINNFWNMEVPWSFEGPIKLNTHARFYNSGNGEYVETWDNAFYSRSSKSIELLSGENKKTKALVHGARSSDVIAHETSHAKLDGLEEYLSDSKCFTNTAIHEAFSDFNAMLHALNSDKVIDILLKETQGNLRKDNLVSNFEEQFGKEVLSEPRSCLRSAINSWKHPNSYEEISFLPPLGHLGIEPHCFSELLTGALYDTLVEKYENNLINFDCCNKASIIEARDTIGRIFNRSLLYLPPAEIEFKNVALAMLQVDKVEFEGKNSSILSKVFKDRNILTDSDIANFEKSQHSLEGLKLSPDKLNNKSVETFLKDNKELLGIQKNKNYSLSKVLIDREGNHFYRFENNIKIKLPDDRNSYFQMANEAIPIKEGITLAFDKDGKLISSIKIDMTENNLKETFIKFKKFCDYRYKPLQDGYDEIEKEIQEEIKRREEKKKRKKEPVNKTIIPTPTIKNYMIK